MLLWYEKSAVLGRLRREWKQLRRLKHVTAAKNKVEISDIFVQRLRTSGARFCIISRPLGLEEFLGFVASTQQSCKRNQNIRSHERFTTHNSLFTFSLRLYHFLTLHHWCSLHHLFKFFWTIYGGEFVFERRSVQTWTVSWMTRWTTRKPWSARCGKATPNRVFVLMELALVEKWRSGTGCEDHIGHTWSRLVTWELGGGTDTTPGHWPVIGMNDTKELKAIQS